MPTSDGQAPFAPIDLWNAEDDAELARSKNPADYEIAIAARDWTVETIVQQIRQGNINLDPAFQRRNAWKDPRRSKLIESLILGFPVPQIVLAENPHKKRSFLVIDGKQRLLTIAGFYLPDYRDYWTRYRLSGLNVRKDLNGVELDRFLADTEFFQDKRQLDNADIRTTVITGFSDETVLYDIFYRINTGSVPLSSQELRQVLNGGPFSRFLVERTSEPNSLWGVLGISSPDARLRDVELLLRIIAWRRFSAQYAGNMKKFLDDAMKWLNHHWREEAQSIEELTADILNGVDLAQDVYGDQAGRKFKGGRFEPSLNRAILEIQGFYFSFQIVRECAAARRKEVLAGFKLMGEDATFISSVEATTKSIENCRTRFSKYRTMLSKTLSVKVPPLDLPAPRAKG